MAFEDNDFDGGGFFTRLVRAVISAIHTAQLRIRAKTRQERILISAEIKESDIIIEGKVK